MTHVAHALLVCLLSVLHSINFAIIAMCLRKFAVPCSCAAMLCCQNSMCLCKPQFEQYCFLFNGLGALVR